MEGCVLKGEGLTKIYYGDGVSVEALKDASFTIYPGEFVVEKGGDVSFVHRIALCLSVGTRLPFRDYSLGYMGIF